MKRDSQRGAVYAWEEKVGKEFPETKKPLSFVECVELVRRVWDDYRPGEKPPEVRDGRGTTIARGSRWRINLPRWSRHPLLVLHETAHSLQRNEPWHGPEFTRLVLELWVRYLKLPRLRTKMLGSRQKPRRVRFASLAASPQRPSRAWRKWKQAKINLEKELQEHRRSEPLKYGQ